MSDAYEALIDPGATVGEAEALATQVVSVLSNGGLIIPNLSSECVLGGGGYPAGPRCSEAYSVDDFGERVGNRFWALKTSGVEICTKPWVNVWGFTQFSGAVCPHCGRDRAEDFLDDVGPLVDDYLKTGAIPSVACSSCHALSSIHHWNCDPHLGFVNFAILFWNWPRFSVKEWSINVHRLIEDHLKRPLVATFGRM